MVMALVTIYFLKVLQACGLGSRIFKNVAARNVKKNLLFQQKLFNWSEELYYLN